MSVKRSVEVWYGFNFDEADEVKTLFEISHEIEGTSLEAGFTALLDGMCGEYVLFGKKLLSIDDYTDEEYINRIDTNKLKSYNKEVIENFCLVTNSEYWHLIEDKTPELYVVNHYR